MDYFPLFIRLTNKQCLVVGGGKVAARKVRGLVSAGATVAVVSPALCAELRTMVSEHGLQHLSTPYHGLPKPEPDYVFTATDEKVVNQTVAGDCRRAGIPVNVVDSPDDCDFIIPSIIDRSPIVAAITTSGSSPVLARMLRARIESVIPFSFGKLAEFTQRFRQAVKDKFPAGDSRRRFWENTLNGPVAEMVFSGQQGEAEKLFLSSLADAETSGGQRGEVYLVGAGPGDPDLLTFRALRLMQQAEVVVYDRLVSKGILDLTRPDAERIYVGKEKGNHAMRQEDINKLLAKLALQGKRVLRLKGGDPFIFGRGGEEIDTLAAEKVPFQVVPGVTAAAGCASYAGIPLTHRDYSQACIFVTGHLKDGTINLNWEMLAHDNQTVVFYMGLTGVKHISEKLMEHGVPGERHAAIIQQGTTFNQRVFSCTVATLPAVVEQEQPQAPTLLIIGDVVELREKLAWFNPEVEHPVDQYHE